MSTSIVCLNKSTNGQGRAFRNIEGVDPFIFTMSGCLDGAFVNITCSLDGQNWTVFESLTKGRPVCIVDYPEGAYGNIVVFGAGERTSITVKVGKGAPDDPEVDSKIFGATREIPLAVDSSGLLFRIINEDLKNGGYISL